MLRSKQRDCPWLARCLIFILTFSGLASPAGASSDSCEQSHLSTDGSASQVAAVLPSLTPVEIEVLAEKLASFRLDSRNAEMSKEDRGIREIEFREKYQAFVDVVGSEEKAQNLFQEQMHKVRFELSERVAKERRERKEEKSREQKARNAESFSLARSGQFISIPPGTFIMSSVNPADRDKMLDIKKSFSMMQTHVTQAMWVRIQILLGEANPQKIFPSFHVDGEETIEIQYANGPRKILPDFPVEQVQWKDANQMIAGLNRLSNDSNPDIQKALKAILSDHELGDVYDLPSEEHWEAAARMAKDQIGYRVDQLKNLGKLDELKKYIVFQARSSKGGMDFEAPQAVASKLPLVISRQPIFDLFGNVRVWVREREGGTRPILRGGSYQDPLDKIGPDQRDVGADSDSKTDLRTVGVRLIRVNR